MKKYLIIFLASIAFMACNNATTGEHTTTDNDTDSTQEKNVRVDRFADLQVLKYEVPGFDQLSAKQKELVYYLSEAALCGRDITYAQNYKYNIQVRRTLEQIFKNYEGDRTGDDWTAFETYLKRVWFSNGIHHHYSEKKMMPEFDAAYLTTLIEGSPNAEWPLLEGESADDFKAKLNGILFDPNIAAKKVNKEKEADKVLESANNYYGDGVTEDEAVAYYKAMNVEGDTTPLSYGLNSRLVKEEGELKELVYKVDGLYGAAIEKMVYWLEKASEVAENDAQKAYIDLLVEYYKTGSLQVWDDCNVQWVQATEGDIDFIHGFIEVYGDALGYKASYESVIEINDFEASDRMAVLADNVQWFEDNSSIMDEHKKAKVTGVSYKVVNVAIEGGDCAPNTPIGINLPNANWIRQQHGSKSVSLGNIVQAYNNAGGKGTVEEFYLTEESQKRRKEHAELAGKMHTAMHEVIGHASGKLNDGIGQPNETLKNYSNTLEEARADLVALYFVYDQKIVDLGLVPDLEVGKAEYDGYIMNGMMLQLRRLEEGENLEEDHMRNRQLVAKWAYEKGKADNVIERKKVDGKTYFVVNDYDKLRDLFGQLLREIQRIKSEGDYESAEALVENYGVVVDQELLVEVKKRYEPFDLAPYSGFVQPNYTAVEKDGKITDVKVEYQDDFAAQMMDLSERYSFLGNDAN